MRTNPLRAIWADGGAALGGWLTVPSSFSAEIMAHGGFDWVCIDMQHGMIDDIVFAQRLFYIAEVELVHGLEQIEVGKGIGRVGIDGQGDVRIVLADFPDDMDVLARSGTGRPCCRPFRIR